MNENLRKAEEKMFKAIYGEEELAKVDDLPPIKLPEYSEHKIVTERDEIDKRNNIK